MSIIKGRMDALNRREEVMAALRSALHDVVYADGAHDPLCSWPRRSVTAAPRSRSSKG